MNKTALVLIDLQLGFDEVAHWGTHRNNPNCEQVCYQLLQRWRQFDLLAIIPPTPIRLCTLTSRAINSKY